jgi:FRG domain
VPTDASEVRAFIEEATEIADQSDCDVFWRGQADYRWGVRSSLARLSETPTALRDTDLNQAEAELLVDAKQWIKSTPTPPSNDLEWLALLQHHWIPTRMVDFTRDPLIATFFAVESRDDVDGRLFGIAIPRSDPVIGMKEAEGFQIGKMPLGELRLWRPKPALSPRLAAQNGVFALGRLPSTRPARHVWDSYLGYETLMSRDEIVSVFSIPLYLVSLDRGRNRRAGSTYPSCFTAKIHVDKSSIRTQLSRRSRPGSLRPVGDPIDHASCYPDVEGLRRFSNVLARVHRGLA